MLSIHHTQSNKPAPSNQRTYLDSLLLRFLRLNPGEIVNNPARNHVVQVRASTIKPQNVQIQPSWTCHEYTFRPSSFATEGDSHPLLVPLKSHATSLSIFSTRRPHQPNHHLQQLQRKNHSKGRYIELPLSQDFVDRMKVAGSICFWCSDHGLWYEVCILTGPSDGARGESVRSSPVL